MIKMEPQSLKQFVADKRVVICCGSGGVGKTTTSAALAIFAATQGMKSLVLTIDPAKRLANSLGLESINHEEREIPAATLKRAGIPVKAPLFAMMLDTKRTFDALILKYAQDPAKADAILNNRLYQHLSSMIAGSQEYMAMEKLHEIIQERDYDLIVLDTPPSRHALDFLEAPGKMQAMIGDSMIQWMLKPSLFVGRAGLKVLDRSMKRVFKSLDKVAGFEFLQDLSEMLVAISGLLGGFHERAKKVQELLHQEQTGFLLVAAPQPIPLREADFFHSKILEFRLPFGGFIFNRVETMPEETGCAPEKLPAASQREYQKIERVFRSLSERDRTQLEQFRKKRAADLRQSIFKVVPQLNHDIHELAGLHELVQHLFAED